MATSEKLIVQVVFFHQLPKFHQIKPVETEEPAQYLLCTALALLLVFFQGEEDFDFHSPKLYLPPFGTFM